MFHVVDDDPALGEILTELITMFDHDVALFTCPVEYLKFLKTPAYVSPVAIISDVKMPQMNGYDFMHQVKNIHPQQKFVMITGTPEMEHVHKNLACMYLCKPFAPDTLKTMTDILMRCQHSCCLQDDEHIDDRAIFNITSWSCPHGPDDNNHQ